MFNLIAKLSAMASLCGVIGSETDCETHGDKRMPKDPLEGRSLWLYNSQTDVYLSHTSSEKQAALQKVQSQSNAKPWHFLKISGDTPGGRLYHIATMDGRFCLECRGDGGVYLSECRMNDPTLYWYYFLHLECDVYDAVFMNYNSSRILDVNPAGYRSPVSAIHGDYHYMNSNAQYQHWKTVIYSGNLTATPPSPKPLGGSRPVASGAETESISSSSPEAISSIAIIGSVLGCIALVVLVTLLGAYVLRRRHQRSRQAKDRQEQSLEETENKAMLNRYETTAPRQLSLTRGQDSGDQSGPELTETKRLLEMMWPDVVRDAAIKSGVVQKGEIFRVSSMLERFELTDPSDLEVGEILGRGNFSVVHSGMLKSSELPVAVKLPRVQQIDNYSSLIAEAVIMSRVCGHQNVLRLIGARTAEIRRLCLVTELCRHGALDRFLRNAAAKFNAESSADESDHATCPNCKKLSTETCECYHRPELTLAHLVWFAYQIAKGLEYLCSKQVIHRDIAARNILVSDSLVLKISDFGLSRNLPEYIAHCSQIPPVQWLAPECLSDGSFTAKSDVYSFGVVVWEVYSLGQTPPRPQNVGKIKRKVSDLIDASPFEKPTLAPVKVYEMMKSCWNSEPTERPSFSHVKADLRKLGLDLYPKAYARLAEILDGEEEDASEETVDEETQFSISGYSPVFLA